MLAFINGRLVPEEQATISILDRGFLYGDGLFETMRVFQGQPFRWADHWERLQRGAELLKIQLPFTSAELLEHARRMIEQNGSPESLLRLTVSRGVGPRGYSPTGANHPTVTMTLHPAPALNEKPPLWRLAGASFRLPAGEILAQSKTCNKLPQILARAEADAHGADEALLMNTDGQVVEGASSNLFWIAEGRVHTPPLGAGVLAGVTRKVVLELCAKLGIAAGEGNITLPELLRAEGVFMSLSSWGVVEAVSLDGKPVARSPLTGKLQQAFADLLRIGD